MCVVFMWRRHWRWTCSGCRTPLPFVLGCPDPKGEKYERRWMVCLCLSGHMSAHRSPHYTAGVCSRRLLSTSLWKTPESHPIVVLQGMCSFRWHSHCQEVVRLIRESIRVCVCVFVQVERSGVVACLHLRPAQNPQLDRWGSQRYPPVLCGVTLRRYTTHFCCLKSVQSLRRPMTKHKQNV